VRLPHTRAKRHRNRGFGGNAPTAATVRQILLVYRSCARAKVDRIFEDAGVERDIRIETQYAMTIGAFVMRGIGCSILNPLSAQELVPHGVVIKPFLPAVRFDYILCLPEHRLPSRIAMSFIDALRAAKARLTDESEVATSQAPTAKIVRSRVRAVASSKRQR
jgi:DNA-binding transcriptional LysR family regulator